MNGEIMSEKRFVAYDKWTDSEGNIFKFVVIDTKKLGDKQFILRCNHWSQAQDICNRLNDTLDELREENGRLRQMIKENVFQRYREGSLADLEFKAIAYDDIVKLEISNELEPKVIVICRQGKKENVKSFCQMFIPFGVAYEIKEVIDDE